MFSASNAQTFHYDSLKLAIGGLNPTSPSISVLKLISRLVRPATRYPDLLILIGQIGEFPCEFNNAVASPQTLITNITAEVGFAPIV
jgi:hypothetical protein